MEITFTEFLYAFTVISMIGGKIIASQSYKGKVIEQSFSHFKVILTFWPYIVISLISMGKFMMKHRYGYDLETVNYVESGTFILVLIKYLLMQVKHKKASFAETKLILLMLAILILVLTG